MPSIVSGTLASETLSGLDSPVENYADSIDGAAGDDTLYGGEGDDTLLGGDGADRLSGGEGSDSLDGGVGPDQLLVDSGSNRYQGGSDVDWLDFSALETGIDYAIGMTELVLETGTLFFEDRIENVRGTTSDDTLMGGYWTGSVQILEGGSGNDFLRSPPPRFTGVNYQQYVFDGGEGDDTIHGGADQDTIIGSAGNDQIHGGYAESYSDDLDVDETNDFDTLSYARANGPMVIDTTAHTASGGGMGTDHFASIDYLIATRFNDTLYGASAEVASDFPALQGAGGNDTLFGGSAGDRANGGPGQDRLYGALGSDQLLGGGGNDLLQGGSNADWLSGDPGNDTLHGGTGPDWLYGHIGDDLLQGASGEDELRGGAGRDTLQGGAGADLLVGEQGDDLLRGGGGPDRFGFGALADDPSADRIDDYEVGSDRIEFSFGTLPGDQPTGAIDPGLFVAGPAALEPDDHFIYDQASGHLYFDVDGSGTEVMRLFLTITPGTALTAADLWVVF